MVHVILMLSGWPFLVGCALSCHMCLESSVVFPLFLYRNEFVCLYRRSLKVLSVRPIYVAVMFSTVACYTWLFVMHLPTKGHVLCFLQLHSGVFITVW